MRTRLVRASLLMTAIIGGFHTITTAGLAQRQQPGPPKLNAPGPRVGAAVPPFSASDQFGRTQTLQSVLGPEGAMLVFFRSADW